MTQLSLQERYYIELRRKEGVTQKAIAKELERSQSAISKELMRNSVNGVYNHKKANEIAKQRHREKQKSKKVTGEIEQEIAKRLKENESSPEQIAGRLKLEGTISLHHETIYRVIRADRANGGTLYKYLRRGGKKYRKRYATNGNSTHGIPNRVDISERPKIVDERGRFGDWEADTIIGKAHKGVIVTLDERVSKFRLALPISSKNSRETQEAIEKLLFPMKQAVHTITFDNGKEFARHEAIAKSLECDTYFAKPYHSWERGQNENANGLLRQYFPKEMGLLDVEDREVLEAVHKLNSRPRKCLGFKTPYEVFSENLGFHAIIPA